jgi:hypothetical protein
VQIPIDSVDIGDGELISLSGPEASTSNAGNLVPSTSQPSQDHRLWARRKTTKGKLLKFNKRDEAVSKIAVLADSKKSFYEDKLKMLKDEHALRMEVLQIKKQFYIKKMAKLGEE